MNDLVTRKDLKHDLLVLKVDLKDSFKKDIRDSFDDITALLHTFMQQVDERFNRMETKQSEDISRIFEVLDQILNNKKSTTKKDWSWGTSLIALTDGPMI